MRLRLTSLLLALALPLQAPAEVKPTRGVYDPRIKTVAYNPDDVVSIVGHYGFSTNVEFARDEQVQSIALGDSLAWEVAPRGNQLFVKPREDNATTNMTVITDRRSYQFWLDAAKAADKGRGDNMYFRVKFVYPQDAAVASGLAEARRRAAAALQVSPPPRNWDYWACGDALLRPSEAYDDGRFTYLRYPAGHEIPAAYVVGSDGGESLAGGSMRGDQLVLQTVASKIVLRRGEAVACLENRSFTPYGVGSATGTTSPVVERRVRDEARTRPTDLPLEPEIEAPAQDDAAPARMRQTQALQQQILQQIRAQQAPQPQAGTPAVPGLEPPARMPR